MDKLDWMILRDYRGLMDKFLKNEEDELRVNELGWIMEFFLNSSLIRLEEKTFTRVILTLTLT